MDVLIGGLIVGLGLAAAICDLATAAGRHPKVGPIILLSMAVALLGANGLYKQADRPSNAFNFDHTLTAALAADRASADDAKVLQALFESMAEEVRDGGIIGLTTVKQLADCQTAACEVALQQRPLRFAELESVTRGTLTRYLGHGDAPLDATRRALAAEMFRAAAWACRTKAATAAIENDTVRNRSTIALCIASAAVEVTK